MMLHGLEELGSQFKLVGPDVLLFLVGGKENVESGNRR